MRRIVIIMIILSGLLILALIDKDYKIETSEGVIYGTLNHESYDYMAIIIAGSGPTDRDSNSDMIDGRNDALKLYAHELNQAGISTFTYDKRSSGKSKETFDNKDIVFGDFVKDAQRVLAEIKGLGYKNIILIGHSQGALIAEIVGLDTEVDGVISLCGTVRPIDQVLIEQFSPLASDQFVEAKRLIEEVKTTGETSNVPESLEVFFGENDEFLYSWMAEDPMDYIEQIANKMLFIYGDRDTQISSEEIGILNSIYRYKVITNMNHVLKTVYNDFENEDSYIRPIYTINEEVIDSTLAFILE